MHEPTISVSIAAYNRGPAIGKTLRSVCQLPLRAARPDSMIGESL